MPSRKRRTAFRHRLSIGGRDDLPRFGRPLRVEQGDGLDMRVDQPDLCVLPDQPLGLVGIARRSGDDAPELRMTLLAVPLRDIAVFFTYCQRRAPSILL